MPAADIGCYSPAAYVFRPMPCCMVTGDQIWGSTDQGGASLSNPNHIALFMDDESPNLSPDITMVRP